MAICNLRVLLALIIGLGLTSPLWSAEKEPAKSAAKESEKASAPRKTAAAKTKKPKIQRHVGNISALDSKSGAVSVKGSNGEKNFMAQDAAKDALERLSVGDRVRVQYTEKDGKLVASSVRRMKLPQTKTKSGTTNNKAKSSEAPKANKEAK